MSRLDAFAAHLVASHGGRACISVEEAAKIVGIGKEHAYRLAGEQRFPVFGVTSASAKRESMQVLIPALIDWMQAGGTRQYDELPKVQGAPRRQERGDLDADLAWLDRQLATA